MKTFAALAVGSVLAASMTALACTGRVDPGGTARADDPVVATATAAEMRGGDRDRKAREGGDSSPFVVGVWKFVPGEKEPKVDTEFRFINPTELTVTLEYAFFELDGTFCGCDRDDFAPNQTTLYTILDELQPTPVPTPDIPNLFSCHGTSGAMKAIVFKHKGERIFLDEATQTGFQTHAFGEIREEDPVRFLTGRVMTEAPLQGVAIDDATLDEVREIHRLCAQVQGPLGP